jgi:hypothetical protein
MASAIRAMEEKSDRKKRRVEGDGTTEKLTVLLTEGSN